MPIFAGENQAALETNYALYVARQQGHSQELWDSLFENIKTAQKADRSNLSQICQDHIAAFWQARLDDATQRQANGEVPLAGSGRFTRFTEPTWPDGDWAAVIAIHISPTSVYVGADQNYFLPDKPLLTYFDVNQKPRYYSINHGGDTFIISHEIGHAKCGSDEDCADQEAASTLTEFGVRIQSGDFRIDMAPIDSETGEVVKNNLP